MTSLLERATRSLLDAPFAEPEGWSDALGLTAEATGAWGAQLIAFSPRTEILWEWWHNISPDVIAEFEARMTGAPDWNPRARALLRPSMAITQDEDIISDEGRRRYADCLEFLDRVEASHAGLVNFAPVPDEARFLLAVLHDRRAGRLSDDDVAALGRLARGWSSALRTRFRLEDHGAALAVGALDVADFPALLIDRSGRPVAVSAQAHRALSSGRHLCLRHGVLAAADPRSEAGLRTALEAVLADPPRSAGETVVLEAAEGALLAEVTPLPHRRRPTHRTAVALMALKPRVGSRRTAGLLLQRLHGLSQAEAEIALHIASGMAVRDLADLRDVSVGTLRGQLKSIFAKCAVASQAQLAIHILRTLGSRWQD
ncbi:hypothetical protein [Phenylobacterium sp.]|uniref:hypothetical protein n=1 Tax=Phenylobacterium sp. TaxID=1871053 RepID=UPI0025F3F704|nr:hypothetical protein [Phenylobacterium sp.]MBX3484271.1 hypothetical protein [Phenylobacterium sp.]MCW5758535.1 hypothetical protein [Phenylobacterium sp.]